MTPCQTITLKTDAVRTYTFYVHTTSNGTPVGSPYSTQVVVTVVCGQDSVVADPVSGTTITKEAGGADYWFDITSISNSAFASCSPTAFAYVTDTSGTDDPAADFADNAAPVAVSGTSFQAKPSVYGTPRSINFALKATFPGGYVTRFAFTLVLSCSATSTGLTIQPDASFSTGTWSSLTLVIGAATQTITFPEFSTLEGCPITGYVLDTDTDLGNGLNDPADATFETSCSESPCRSISVTTDALKTITLYIRVSAQGVANEF